MGLQNQLSDVSSDSIPLFLLFHIANCVSYLRKVLFGFLQSLGLSRFHPNPVIDDGFLGAVGSGLASVVLLAEQLNSRFSYTYSAVRDGESGGAAAIGGPKCVVCLCRLRDGDPVRRLPCRHVFHRHCFEGWLNEFKFNCPTCRLPLVSDERVVLTEKRVGGELISWFSSR